MLIVVAVALLGLSVRLRAPAPSADEATIVSEPASPGAAATASDVAAWPSRTLPGGGEYQAPPEGIEHRLVALLDDPLLATSDTSWLEFDRVTFADGSTTLQHESRQQLRNVAAILEAYPTVSLAIGSHTDNTGNAAENLRLSQERAHAVRHELERLGIAPTRLMAEGYGDRYPVADNATAEGRARNRRIALRVTHQ